MVVLRSGVLCAVVLFFCMGCAERQAQRAVQVTMSSLAHTINATDEIVDPLFKDAALDAREQVVEERQSDMNITIEQGMDRYRELMRPWYKLLEGLVLSRRLLLIGQSALNTWMATGDLPREWGEFCEGVLGSFVNLIAILNEVSIGVPDQLEQLVPHTDTMCEISVSFIVTSIE